MTKGSEQTGRNTCSKGLLILICKQQLNQGMKTPEKRKMGERNEQTLHRKDIEKVLTYKVFKLTHSLRTANKSNPEGALPMCQTGMKCSSGQTGQRYPLGTLCSQPGPSDPASRNLPYRHNSNKTRTHRHKQLKMTKY